MTILVRLHLNVSLRALMLACTLVWLGEAAHGQALTSQVVEDQSNRDDVNEALSKVKQGGSDSMYSVERLVQQKVPQAIPLLEQKFNGSQDSLLKEQYASALMRLGDANNTYWEFLVSEASLVAESDGPDFLIYNQAGAAEPGPSPEFKAWVETHNLSLQQAGAESLYVAPARLHLLAIVRDPRGIPILRKALLSPNHLIEIAAAEGLAEIHDNASIPFIISAAAKAPSEVGKQMAIMSLVRFDDQRARSFVEEVLPKEQVNALRAVKIP